MEDAFEETVKRLLKDIGRTFRCIRLQCKACGEEAFAATPEVAEMFGWSHVTKLQGASYEGFCVDCKDCPPT